MELSSWTRLAKNFKQCCCKRLFMWTRKGAAGGGQKSAAWANTQGSFVKDAVKEGFTESFKLTSRGLYAKSSGRYFRPEQIRVVDTRHLENQQQGTSIMYILESFDGVKGTLVEEGSQAIAFISEAEAYQARVSRFNKHHC